MGGTGRVNPIPNGASVWNGPPYQENCLFVCFFPPDPTPFPGTRELFSNHFYQNITFVSFIFFCFFFDLFHVSDPIFHGLMFE